MFLNILLTEDWKKALDFKIAAANPSSEKSLKASSQEVAAVTLGAGPLQVTHSKPAAVRRRTQGSVANR